MDNDQKEEVRYIRVNDDGSLKGGTDIKDHGMIEATCYPTKASMQRWNIKKQEWVWNSDLMKAFYVKKIKLYAGALIRRDAPSHKQTNYTNKNISLLNKVMSGKKLTNKEQTEQKTIIAFFDKIDSIRDKSNYLEKEVKKMKMSELIAFEANDPEIWQL